MRKAGMQEKKDMPPQLFFVAFAGFLPSGIPQLISWEASPRDVRAWGGSRHRIALQPNWEIV
jgi:hypothetical protein